MKKRENPRTDGRQVREVMTRDPACCLPSDSAQQAARIMQERDAGIVPVIDNDRDHKLVGVVTDRDLCLCVVAAGREANTTIQECMTPKAVCAHPEDSVEKAIELMEDNQVRRIPVIDHDNRIQGILSLADIVRRSDVDDEMTHEVLEKISEPTGEASKPRAEAGRQHA